MKKKISTLLSACTDQLISATNIYYMKYHIQYENIYQDQDFLSTKQPQRMNLNE